VSKERDLIKRMQELEEENQRLQNVLKFYANPNTYIEHQIDTRKHPDDPAELAFYCPIEEDGGAHARVALGDKQ